MHSVLIVEDQAPIAVPPYVVLQPAWKRHGEVVLMSAELELAAWDLQGNKLWSAFVEPPWTYEVHGTRVALEVMGQRSDFNVTAGPEPRDSEVAT